MFDPNNIRLNQARMEKNRSTHDRYWTEIAALCYPELESFQGGQMKQSPWMRNQVRSVGSHDPYTVEAVQDGVSLFESYVMPRGQRWQKLALGDEELMKDVEVLQWLEKVEIRLFGLRNDPESGFVANIHDSAMSLFTFGPQSLWVDDRYDDYGRWAGLRYESEYIGDIWVERDASGRIIRIHRRIVMTAEQAHIKWGAKAPELVRKAMEGNAKNQQQEFEFLHVIERNTKMDANRIDAAGKPWLGCYYSVSDNAVFDIGGYHSLPRLVSSFRRPGNVTYGRSPAMTALPLIRKCMQIDWDRSLGAELRLLPPLLTADNELDNAVLELRALGVTEGGLNDRGEPLVKEFLTQSDANDAEKLYAEARQLEDKIFFRDMLQLDREYKSHIPAARIEEERSEKGILLAPLSMQEAEWLSPMTAREMTLMARHGMMDDMPDKVKAYLHAQGTLGLKYDNGLTQLQEAGKSAAFLSVAGQIGSLAQFNPQYVEFFNREYPPEKVITELGRIAGIPASMRSTEEERAAFDQQQAQKAQLDQLLAAAPALAGAAKDAAAAGQPMPSGMMGA
ncbi:portal protein [Novosphingobium sp.]|uniref:portal protein n=1 Tax=Novosphingobium sp. TaxID=1874826 RepID=UPI0031D0DDD3